VRQPQSVVESREGVCYNSSRMVTPRIVPRAEHPISRRHIDPDALKVLNRLRQFGHVAYLVGGSVRDLLLERRPKDFDIGTSAHPYEIKRVFRNCWIVGRRFRLAHVKFGPKTIEVATFRRQISEADLDNTPIATPPELADDAASADERASGRTTASVRRDHLIYRDNAFGTPEEDAFRRDFTVNALFYDIATFSIIDYVGGLDDLHARIIRCIGDPDIRFREDPVRMLRAIVLAARLDFTVDAPILDAIRRHASEIARSAPARLLDELYKILRSGASERAFRELADVGLLQWIAPELLAIKDHTFGHFLSSLDAYRRRFNVPPESLTNAVLLGTILVPRGFTGRRALRTAADTDAASRAETTDEAVEPARREWRDPKAALGILPLARRDIERVGQLLALQRKLKDTHASPRAKRALMHRGPFQDALTWLEIHGDSSELVEHWRQLVEVSGPSAPRGEDQRPAFRHRRSRRGRGPRRPMRME
jgi:poly(A) polymerase